VRTPEVLAALAERGAWLRLRDDGRPEVRTPRGALPPALLEATRACTEELAAILRGAPSHPCRECGGLEWWLGAGGTWECAACSPPGAPVACYFAGRPRPRGHLVRLGLALGLRPRCRFTVREQGAPEAAQRFAQAVADLCRRHRGSEAVLMVAVELDGERVPVLWRAAVGAGLRRALAELVRDYHLGLGPFGVWRVDDVSGPDDPPPAPSPAAVQPALPLDGGRR
jgi:hypothetical protein